MRFSIPQPQTRRCWRFWLRLMSAGTLLLAIAGCTESYWTETVLVPDGTIKRAIYQPWDATPAAVREPKSWTKIGFAPEPGSLGGQGRPESIAQLPIHPEPRQGAYFVAWGHYDSVDRVPDHLVFKVPDPIKLPDGRLVRRYARHDYGLLVEYRWTETLTDCVTIEDMRRARKELEALLIEVAAEAFDAAFGKAYDASELVAALKTEGVAWFDEITDLLFRPRAEHEKLISDRVKDQFAAVCERHGLRLKRNGQFLDGEGLSDALNSFAIDRLVGTVKTDEGRYLNREEATALLDILKTFGDTNATVNPFRIAVKKVIADRHGGEAGFNQQLGTLALRVFGLHLGQFLASRNFDFSLTCPGVIVETNGETVAANRVRWRFEGSEAFPSGFAMRCRSLDPDAKIVALPQGKALKERKTMLRFVDLVAGRERLTAALRDCRRDASFAPLVGYRAEAQAGPDAADEVKRLDALLTLFHIPRE